MDKKPVVKEDPEKDVDERFRGTCPDCYSPLVAQPHGGVKCSNPDCAYWFCF